MRAQLQAFQAWASCLPHDACAWLKQSLGSTLRDVGRKASTAGLSRPAPGFSWALAASERIMPARRPAATRRSGAQHAGGAAGCGVVFV